jgi:hypothetical protein
MKAILFSSLLFLIPTFLSAQISFDAGTGVLKGFGAPKSFGNLHLGIEVPRSTDQSVYGRFSYFFPVTESTTQSTIVTGNNTNINPYNLTVNYDRSTNYALFEGGTRKYIGNDFDYGFSGYSGTNVMVIVNKVKNVYSNTDATGQYTWADNYSLSPSEEREGTILSLALGLQIGVKYTFAAMGTVYADLSGQYLLTKPTASNYTASQTQLLSSLFLLFNVGFRKDLY